MYVCTHFKQRYYSNNNSFFTFIVCFYILQCNTTYNKHETLIHIQYDCVNSLSISIHENKFKENNNNRYALSCFSTFFQIKWYIS